MGEWQAQYLRNALSAVQLNSKMRLRRGKKAATLRAYDTSELLNDR